MQILTKIFRALRRRLLTYILLLNRYIFFSNSLRMWVYRKVVKLKIGANTILWVGNMINAPEQLTIGRNTIIGPNNVFLSRGGVEIGNNVNISGFSFFISQGHHLVGSDFTKTKLKKIQIKDRAWIATNSTIMPGVIIKEGGVVGAGSVVTKNVEAWNIVAGNPARVIGIREIDENYSLDDQRGLKWF